MKKKFYRYKRFWLLLALLSYTLLGFFYVPKVIKQQAQQQLASQLEMQAELGEVSFNPFTFTTEIKQLKLTDRQQNNWFNSAVTGINFDPLNLLWGEWKFSDLKLEQPEITIRTDANGQVLIPALPELPATAQTDETIQFSIDNIRLNGGRMGIQAGNIKHDFALNIKSLEIQHDKFSVLDEDTQFVITITTEHDEVIKLDGLYNHAQQQISSQLILTDWQATTLNGVLPDGLQINNQQGLIDVTGNIDWPLQQKPVLNLSQVNLTDVHSSWQQAVNLSGLQASLNDVVVDTEQERITVASITSKQSNWQVNWPIALSEAADSPAADSTDSPGWQIHVDRVAIENWPVDWQDRTLEAAVPIHIDSLELTDLNNHNQAFSLLTQLNIAAQGQVNLSSTQSLSPLRIDSEVDIQALALEPLTAWITDQSGLVFTQGQLSTTQQLQWQDDVFTVNGALTVNDAVIQNQSGQDIADVGQLIIGATTVSSADQTIVVDQITLDQANGSIIVDAEKNINIQNLKPAAEASPETNTETTNSSEWVIKVGAINIKDTSTALIDQSVQPPVKTSISELNGQIKGLSSETLSKADVDISGKFNQFSPLSIQGQINPLSSDAYTDIKVLIEDLDLLAFSPYAATYVAFPVNGGKLNVELAYTLNQHELIGKNNLLFKQLKFGDKVNAPDAVDLPLKLAVSLLTDGKGEMKINLPVSGNLNDPEFSYGSLVGKAIFKLITSIVASPFKILGALIPNPDPNLSDIQFTSGSAELLPSEQAKLDQIAAIMAQKPELNLQLNPQISQPADLAGLQSQRLIDKAPFVTYDLADPTVTQWLEVQLTPEELATYGTENGYDYDKIWQALLQQQRITEADHQALTEQRNLSIKNYLIDSAGITAEKVFVEQAQAASNNQSMVKIGVSR